MHGHDILALGGSAGGYECLRQVAAHLPADLPASLFVVQHTQPYTHSYLPEILSRVGPLPARHPEDREPIKPGVIYVAPPDYHLLVGPGFVRLVQGPRENLSRPALDPLFRTAAVSYGPRVVGVVLSGLLDDGTAGLAAVKARGGVAVVQEPLDASYPDMPASALRHVAVDYRLPLSQIAPALVRLVHEPVAEKEGGTVVPEELNWEAAAASWDMEALQSPERPGVPSPFTCPDCNGSLWEIETDGPLRFRCRTGHAWSPLSLLAGQAGSVEAALNEAFRTLKEKEHLELRLARRSRETRSDAGAAYHERQAGEAKHAAAVLHGLLLHLRSVAGEVQTEGNGELENEQKRDGG
jgi:two-component system chemotaxis response regulator CheB